MSDFKPLKGSLILDCSTLLPGPAVAKRMIDFGAEVIKIENPGRPDGAKTLGRSYYNHLNRDKQIVDIDLKTKDGKAEFSKLVKRANGLVEGFRPAAKKRLGLDEKNLHSLNRRLCILSIVGYPETGKFKDRAGHDLNFQAVTGIISRTPSLPALPLADLFGVAEGVTQLLAMLMEQKTKSRPKGRRATICLYDILRQAQEIFVDEYKTTGVKPVPQSTIFLGRYPCYNLYETQDGRRVAVAAIEHKFWREFCELIELEELGDSGQINDPEVLRRVQGAMKSKSWAEWKKKFEKANCCVDLVMDYTEVYGGVQS